MTTEQAWGTPYDESAGWDEADRLVKIQKEHITKRVCKNAGCEEKLSSWDINTRGGECRACYHKDDTEEF